MPRVEPGARATPCVVCAVWYTLHAPHGHALTVGIRCKNRRVLPSARSGSGKERQCERSRFIALDKSLGAATAACARVHRWCPIELVSWSQRFTAALMRLTVRKCRTRAPARGTRGQPRHTAPPRETPTGGVRGPHTAHRACTPPRRTDRRTRGTFSQNATSTAAREIYLLVCVLSYTLG